MLELQEVTRRYGDIVALDGVSFTVGKGQMRGLVGRNARALGRIDLGDDIKRPARLRTSTVTDRSLARGGRQETLTGQ